MTPGFPTEADLEGLTVDQALAAIKAHWAANAPPPRPSYYHVDAWVPKAEDPDLGPHMLLVGEERRAYVAERDRDGQMTLVALYAALFNQDDEVSHHRSCQKLAVEAWNDALAGGIVDG